MARENTMKIFITGITGFVGSNLARYFIERGHRVSGLVRQQSNLWRLAEIQERISLYVGDLLDKESLRHAVLGANPDVIFHFGVYPYLQTDLEKIFATGLFSTHHLLEVAKEAKVKVFVNIGSSSEYGTKKDPMSEQALLEPNSYYAIGKSAQTHLVSYFSKKERMPAVTLRLFSVYGPYEDETRFVPTLIRFALSSQDMPLNQEHNARDFVYVEDVCRACERAMKMERLGEVVNVGSGVQHTLREAFDLVKKITDSSMSAKAGAYQDREFDTVRWVADMTHAKQALGFEPKTSFLEGLQKTVQWFQEKETCCR
jgi:nucleoside-diphosphate-sugar epimerase